MFFRALIDILKLSAAILVMVGAWSLWHMETLHRLDDRYRQRNDYQRRLDEAKDDIARLESERAELARGGFPAEKTLRERYLFGKAGEKVFLLERVRLAARS